MSSERRCAIGSVLKARNEGREPMEPEAKGARDNPNIASPESGRFVLEAAGRSPTSKLVYSNSCQAPGRLAAEKGANPAQGRGEGLRGKVKELCRLPGKRLPKGVYHIPPLARNPLVGARVRGLHLKRRCLKVNCAGAMLPRLPGSAPCAPRPSGSRSARRPRPPHDGRERPGPRGWWRRPAPRRGRPLAGQCPQRLCRTIEPDPGESPFRIIRGVVPASALRLTFPFRRG